MPERWGRIECGMRSQQKSFKKDGDGKWYLTDVEKSSMSKSKKNTLCIKNVKVTLA